MLKDLKYTGYSTALSDYECPDGCLGSSLNLFIDKSAALRPVSQPKLLLKISTSQAVRCIHKVSSATNYIIYDSDGGDICWISRSDINPSTCRPEIPFVTLLSIGDAQLYSITPVGNTLVVLASSGMYYILWKDSGYSLLGSHIPECPLRFGLDAKYVSQKFTVQLAESVELGGHSVNRPLSQANKDTLTSQILAAVNKFIADESVEKGRFIFPFFVRYALRLFDGSLTMHSAPVLMIATSGNTPQAAWDSSPDGVFSGGSATLFAHTHALSFAAVSQEVVDSLKKWGDIVHSVDIFISAPIYSYDQNGSVDHISVARQGGVPYSVSRLLTTTAGGPVTTASYYKKNPIAPDISGSCIDIPYRESKDIVSDMESCAQFYLLKSIPLDEIPVGMTALSVDKGVLSSLVTREVMTDDYDSHVKKIPKVAFPYNGRLNIASLSYSCFDGHHPLSLFSYCNSFSFSGVSSSGGSWGSTSGDRGTTAASADSSTATGSRADGSSQVTAYVCVYIKRDDKDIRVCSVSSMFDADTPVRYFFYPDTKAYKAVLVMTSASGTTCHELPLKPHDFLNGAFFCGNSTAVSTSTPPQAAGSNLFEAQGKLYTSEVNNPFNFPLLGISTIGAGAVIGLASAAKALSQGQFGQFPLYAFTTEGVWALEVSATGSFSSRQTVTRDVCINPDGITPIDSAVLFPTARGIMLLSGSEASCISNEIDTGYPFNISSLPHISSALTTVGLSVDDVKIYPFFRFLSQAKMIYDYTCQRVILYNPSLHYAYLYSLDSKRWGMMQGSIVSAVNSYPEALAMDSTGQLLDYSSVQSQPATPQFLLTRPLKLDNPDILKTIDTVIQRGCFRRGYVSSLLYGSRDLANWHLVWSSSDHYLRGFRGTPYKYFRIALVCGLNTDESISGTAIQFTPRFTINPR